MTEYLTQINVYLDQIFAYGPFWVYAVIFVACFMENIVPPIPGDSFIVVAGALIAADRLDVWQAMLAVNAGGMLSIMLYYALGRRFGRDFFLRKNFKFFSAEDILATERRFERWGGLLLVLSRFVVGFRVILAIAAGIGKYPAAKMFVYTLISYILFSGLLVYLGYKLVEHFDVIGYYFRTYNYIAWPLVFAIVAVFVYRRVKRIRERSRA
ncbi:hypothetical protein GF377_07930 [candidate division GN15 bacterium]|nr:hypothetical protein [candidate division GN15 bacterium]